jgi:hypothetical protein
MNRYIIGELLQTFYYPKVYANTILKEPAEEFFQKSILD